MRYWINVFVLLIAWGWIIVHAPHDSLWYDETVNAYLATSSWSEIWHWTTQIDNQLPLHFVILKLWTMPFGSSEFALRLLSYWSGLLTIAGLQALARQLTYRQSAGWLTALLCLPLGGFLYATSEVRTYGLAIMILVWSLLWMIKAWHKPYQTQQLRIAPFAIHGILLLLLAYTHYTAWILIAWQGLYSLFKQIRYYKTRFSLLALSISPALFGILGWLILLQGRDINDGTAFEGTVSGQTAFETYISFAVYGQKIFTPIAIERAYIIFGFGLLIGISWLLRRPQSEVLFILGMGILPLVVMVVLSSQFVAKLSGRHLWPLWVALPLLLSGGITVWAKTINLKVMLLISLAMFMLLMWARQVPLEEEYRGDFRAAFAILREEAHPDDLLVLRDGTLFTAAEYYRSPIEYVGIPNEPLTDVEHQIEIYEALDLLKSKNFTERQRVWVLSWQAEVMDPTALGWGILDYYSQGERSWWLWPKEREVSLVSYTIHPPEEDILTHIADYVGVIQVPPDGPSLLGYDVYYPQPQNGICSAIIQTWWWRGTTDYLSTLVSVRLADENGERIAQIDAPPAGFFYPQTRWTPFVPILGRFELIASCQEWKSAHSLHMVVYDAEGRKPTQPILLDTYKMP